MKTVLATLEQLRLAYANWRSPTRGAPMPAHNPALGQSGYGAAGYACVVAGVAATGGRVKKKTTCFKAGGG
jgi:hypothetical protein